GKPTNTNAACQPTLTTKRATSGGVRIAPMLAPLTNRPTAVDRSCSGNHSATTFIPPEKFPDSERPSRKRKQLNDNTPRARLVRILTIDHMMTMMENPRLDPTQSMKIPAKDWPNVYASRKALMIIAMPELVK